MKSIWIFLILGLFLISGCVQYGSKLDLSTPESAAKACIDAFKSESKEILTKYLSKENLVRFNRHPTQYIEGWKGSIEECGGKITEITGSEMTEDNEAIVMYKLKGSGCSPRFHMKREGNEWKFDET